MGIFHISTRAKRKYTSHEDMLKEFNDNPRVPEQRVKKNLLKITGNENLITSKILKPICNTCPFLNCVMGEESFIVCQKCGYVYIIEFEVASGRKE